MLEGLGGANGFSELHVPALKLGWSITPQQSTRLKLFLQFFKS